MGKELVKLVVKGALLLAFLLGAYLISGCEKNKKGTCHMECSASNPVEFYDYTKQECDDYAADYNANHYYCDFWWEEGD
jgi:hypothetical protein